MSERQHPHPAVDVRLRSTRLIVELHVGKLHRFQLLADVDELEHGQVAPRIGGVNVRIRTAAAGETHVDFAGTINRVIVREDQPGGVDYHASCERVIGDIANVFEVEPIAFLDELYLPCELLVRAELPRFRFVASGVFRIRRNDDRHHRWLRRIDHRPHLLLQRKQRRRSRLRSTKIDWECNQDRNRNESQHQFLRLLATPMGAAPPMVSPWAT